MSKGSRPNQAAAQASAGQKDVSGLGPSEARVARLEGQIELLRAQIAALEAADEHRRTELLAAQSQAADALATTRELQARLEERQQLIEELRGRLKSADADKELAQQERAAVIASLGWRAKRRLAGSPEQG